MVKAKLWKMQKMFDGVPKEDDVQLVEEELPALKDGGKVLSTINW